MEKLINIASKIGKKIKTNDIREIYNILVTDAFFRPLCLSLGGNSTVKLVFLIKAFKDGRELREVMERLQTDLFTFSLIEVSNDAVEDTCGSCGGDGSYACHECGGSGDVECPDCDGSGDDEDGVCQTCSGDGRVECDYCEGSGSEDCDDCYGSGSVDDDYAANVEVSEYVSIEKDIFNVVEMLDEFEDISFNNIIKGSNGYTLVFRYFDSTSYQDAIVNEKGSTLFYEFNAQPEFVVNNSRKYPILDSGLVSHIS